VARVLVPNGAAYAVVSSLRALTRRGDHCELACESRRRRGRSVYVRDIRWLPSASRGSVCTSAWVIAAWACGRL